MTVLALPRDNNTNSQQRFLERVSSKLGVNSYDIDVFSDSCVGASVNGGWSTAHIAGGNAAILVNSASQRGGVMRAFTSTGGTDLGHLFAAAMARSDQSGLKYAFGGRINPIAVGTVGAGHETWVGMASGAVVGSALGLAFGVINAGSATNLVLAKMNSAGTYVDTGVAAGSGISAFSDFLVIFTGTAIEIYVNGVLTNLVTDLTGMGVTADNLRPRVTAYNGGLTAAREMYVQDLHFGVPRI